MKIKFIKAPGLIGLGYFINDIAEMEEKRGAELIERGFAELVKEDNSEFIEDAKPKKKTK